MPKSLPLLIALSLFTRPLIAEDRPPLVSEPVVAALATEISGESAMRNLEYLARHHRMRGSRGYRAAAEHIAEQLRTYGLRDVRILEFPADGQRFYGTQKSRPAWNAEFAELWELRPAGDSWTRATRLASWEAMPITLAQDSRSAEVSAELVDVGEGTSEGDYAGKDVRGRLVLAAAQPGPVARLAVERYGAAGIISYAQNQRTAWWGENENLVRWGHLDTFAPTSTFGFMVSLKQARSFRERLARGDTVRLEAVVRAGQQPGTYDVVTATIPGRDRPDEEIVFSCHLDHPRPGANDNASGCATILEVARTFAKLTGEGRLPQPRRTIRFVWPPEIEGTLALLEGWPELVPRLKAVVHMDMVGGGPETRAIFHVTRGPASLPSFINDVAEAFGRFANRQSGAFARTGVARYPLNAPEGGKEALQAEFVEFTMGSDHQVYTDSSFSVPAIYLNDWPDRYIHTNFDVPAHLDPTKLKRAAFIGAASAWFLAMMTEDDAGAVLDVVESSRLRRTAAMLRRVQALHADEAANLARFHLQSERGLVESIERFVTLPASERDRASQSLRRLEDLVGTPGGRTPATGDGQLIFRRNPDLRGPLAVFGYDYFLDHYGEERAAKLGLLSHRGARGTGSEYAYELLNLVDGRRTAQAIRDDLAAIYGPVPLALVVEYLRALETIEVVLGASSIEP